MALPPLWILIAADMSRPWSLICCSMQAVEGSSCIMHLNTGCLVKAFMAPDSQMHSPIMTSI